MTMILMMTEGTSSARITTMTDGDSSARDSTKFQRPIAMTIAMLAQSPVSSASKRS